MSDTPTNIAHSGLAVGEYVLEEKIGSGTFGEVWRGRHRAWNDHFVAVKIPTDPQFLRQLQSEGFSLHRLTHPNIVGVVGFDPAGQPPYLMYELVDGPSLRQVLDNGRLPASQVIAILKQVLRGLAYAHGRNVVHGDLKPENVLVDKSALGDGYTVDGTVKLTDFGVGRVASAVPNAGSSRLMRSDTPGVAGTLAYIAPEQREGSPPDALCDLFACGVVLFELITGERPGGAEMPSDLQPSSPRALDEIFRRAYARRDRRYSSADEFLLALNAIDSAPVPVDQAPPQLSLKMEAGEDVVDHSLPLNESLPMPPTISPIDPIAPTPQLHAPDPIAIPGPMPSSMPSVPRPSMRQNLVVIDEFSRRPLRTNEELRNLFRRIYLTRELQADELEPLKPRLDAWAEKVGGLPEFSQRLTFTQAMDTPYHRVVVQTVYQEPTGLRTAEESAVMLANVNAGQDCSQFLKPDDFIVFLHVSVDAIPMTMLEMVPAAAMRVAINNLLTSARSKANGRAIQRQDLKVARASVLTLRYPMDGIEQGICFAGNGLKVIAPTAPVTRLRDEAIRRIAVALDSENIGAGITELRRLLGTGESVHPRAERMLAALHSKLSTAYVQLARQTASNLGFMEALNYSAKAAELSQANPEIRAIERSSRRNAFWTQVLPGLVIGGIFAIFANSHRTPPRLFDAYAAASAAAVLTGIIIWLILGARLSRTDAAFCHACLMPLALAGILATGISQFGTVGTVIFCAVLCGLLLYADRMFFRRYHRDIVRPMQYQIFGGAPLDILNQIQMLIEPDWDNLRDHYIALDPLSRHATGLSSDHEEPSSPHDEPPPLN